MGTPQELIFAHRCVREVADAWSVSSTDICGRSRKKEVVLPRHVAAYLIKKHTLLILEQIGEFFDGRDHSTVINSLRKVEQEMSVYPDFRAKVESLDSFLKDVHLDMSDNRIEEVFEV